MALKGANMKKLNSLILLGILVTTSFVVINPVSATNVNVYSGKDAIVNGNNLINAVKNSKTGDTIRIHAGTYQVTKTIIIPFDNIKIVGDDPFTTIIDASGNSDSCITTDKSNMAIKNITIKNLTIKNSSADAINLGSDSEISNCVILNNKGHGIFADLNTKIQYCFIENNGLEGIDVNNNGTVENVISRNNGGNNIRVGSYSTIKNCLSSNSKSNDGIYADSNSKVINCTSSNNFANGIKVGNRTIITNCITTTNGLSGIDGSSSVSVTYTNSWKNKKDFSVVTRGEGCFSKDPKFTSKEYSWKGWADNQKIEYFLTKNSPCINSGSELSKGLNLENGWSTVLDDSCDTGTVDIGFHFASKCKV